MILIIAAMQEELDALKALGSNVEDTLYKDIRIVKMMLSGKDVILCQSGVGKINASYTTSILSLHFEPKLIINIGSAGGLQDIQKIGDIVIADLVLSHDFDIGEDTHKDPRFIYHTHSDIVDLTEKTVRSLKNNVHRGKIVSGDQFVTFESYAYKRIKEIHPDAICVEMEASAIGAVASRLEIPFVIIRSISDVPIKDGNEVEFEKYLLLASKNSANITQAFVNEYKKNHI